MSNSARNVKNNLTTGMVNLSAVAFFGSVSEMVYLSLSVVFKDEKQHIGCSTFSTTTKKPA